MREKALLSAESSNGQFLEPDLKNTKNEVTKFLWNNVYLITEAGKRKVNRIRIRINFNNTFKKFSLSCWTDTKNFLLKTSELWHYDTNQRDYFWIVDVITLILLRMLPHHNYQLSWRITNKKLCLFVVKWSILHV